MGKGDAGIHSMEAYVIEDDGKDFGDVKVVLGILYCGVVSVVQGFPEFVRATI